MHSVRKIESYHSPNPKHRAVSPTSASRVQVIYPVPLYHSVLETAAPLRFSAKGKPIGKTTRVVAGRVITPPSTHTKATPRTALGQTSAVCATALLEFIPELLDEKAFWVNPIGAVLDVLTVAADGMMLERRAGILRRWVEVRIVAATAYIDRKMFPLNDFSLACCTLATFSAAVGYKLSRRLRHVNAQRNLEDERRRAHLLRWRDSITGVFTGCDVSLTDISSEGTEPPASDCPTPSENASDDTDPGTLKRKSREDDPTDVPSDAALTGSDGRPSASPPLKKRRTPLEDEEPAVAPEPCELVLSYPSPSPCPVPVVDEPVVAEVVAIEVSTNNVSTAHEPSPCTSPVVHDIPLSQPSAIPVLAALAPSSAPIPAVKPSIAFEAFSDSRTSLSLASSAAMSTGRPAWCANSMPASVVGEGRTDARDVIQSDALFNVAKSTHSIKSAISSSPREDPLAAHSYSKGTHPTVTGEEDEDVSAELKGAKLFIKRGEREFSDGILGHVKLLAHRESGAQRLLFRREPVWKVSMSVRLRPAVRCTFDEEQAVLRVVLKELVDGTEQVVVYALKRGKAPKGGFEEFARAVVESSQHLAVPREGTVD
ncbi:hypothetical protein A0H81_06264 [Grifola frondosa]|uniref:RanBD1 domain-containing protein n=1 Tax=Grifola frondosa TaxID=5627 RepID=A0A1C7MAZ2_GRIFR|nr:hypothetical protein A0H81_06264 [Grifola frondosa]